MTTTTRIVEPTAEHKVLREKILTLIKEEAGNIPASELLGLMSQIVGNLIAYQDAKTMTVPMAYEIVARNIEAGNKAAVENPPPPLTT